MNKDLKILLLSALLHDIGKFAQRAEHPCSKNKEEKYLTRFEGKPRHRHTLYTDYFLENDLPLPAELEDSRSHIARIASAHHRPDEKSLSEMCLMIADRLSSGSDWIQTGEEESETKFQEARLLSVFDEIELLKHSFAPPGRAFHDLVPLEADTEKIFPSLSSPKESSHTYPDLFSPFLSELKKIKTDIGFYFYIESLISVLEKYTWCIPSSTYKTMPDVSLFDHGFITAGIAQALFIYHSQDGLIPNTGDSKTKFILTGGNLSGIQNYIFGISKNSGRGVSKIYRARSFFLQAAVRSIILEIQKKFGLFSVCRFADSGGKFILLLPLTDNVQNELNELDQDIQTWFRKKFKGLLTLNLSNVVQMTQQDFKPENFQSKIDEVNDALEESKCRKLNRTFSKMGTVIHEGYEEIEDGNCRLCSVNAADSKATEIYRKMEGFSHETYEDISISICSDCCQQISYIGTCLPRTKYLIYGTEEYAAREKVRLFADLYLSLSKDPPSDLKNVVHVETLEHTGNFSRTRMARYLPVLTKDELTDPKWFNLFDQDEKDWKLDENQPKTFNMIAHKSKKERGEKLVGRGLLGFFKADVDNLGLIISLGLENKLSAARFASVSRMLNIFFSEYLVKMVEKDFPDIYVVFAGGDDLFMVGPWNQTVCFAVAVRKKLRQFCAYNPDITMSGGIFAAKPRFPMRKAVELAEHNLEKAKKVDELTQYLKKLEKAEKVGEQAEYNPETSEKLQEKDSVCFMDQPLSWSEFEELVRIGGKFDKAVEEKARTNFTTGFLFRLLTYHRMYREFIQEGKIRSGRYLSLAYYDIGRNIYDSKGNNREELEMLYKIFSTGAKERPVLEKLNIPLFYAINLNRERE